MDVSAGDILFAFALTLIAGLSTGIGSALAFYTKQTDHKFLSGTLGFSAGVMIYVSFVEIFAKANASLTAVYGAGKGYWATIFAFFLGVLLIALIDKFVPTGENPHEIRDVSEMSDQQAPKTNRETQLLRMGLFHTGNCHP